MEEEIFKSISALQKEGLLVFPTDTIWGLGCDATNEQAVQKIYELKKRNFSKALICLVPDIRMLEKYVYEVPEIAYDIIEMANKPTTIIYDQPINVASNLVAEDNTLAIRVVKDEFCQKLLWKFKKPIVATSANISGGETPGHFKEINSEILKGVDYVVNLHREKRNNIPSSIIKLENNGIVKVIRK